MTIDERAIISESANISSNATIGAYTVIGDNVEIDSGTIVDSHAVINGPTKIGKNNRIYSFASIGGDPQDITYKKGDKSTLTISDNNIFREFCTINRGTEKENSITSIGSNNLFMSYVHIAHDCHVGNNVIMANNASLAGHVKLYDYAFLGGFTLVKQFCAIGESTYFGFNCTVNKDVPPFVVVSGHPTRVRCVNTVGLNRRKFNDKSISAIKRAFKAVYRSQGKLLDAILVDLEKQEKDSKEVNRLIEFIRISKQGIMTRGYEE